MKLDEVLFAYEETSFRWLKSEIRKINNGVPHAILQDYVENLYKRRLNTYITSNKALLKITSSP